jgi:hypothetical protein
MEPLHTSFLGFLLAALGAAGADGPPVLAAEHVHPSGAFSFRTPASWKLSDVPGEAEASQASGDGVIVRFVYRRGESGFDSVHGMCMLERLAGAMDTFPQVKYEYDFLSGKLADMNVLDSAFVVSYDAPVLGEREWRQRNVTLVGNGQSLCVISYAPASAWKKSKATRALLDAILESVRFK